MFVFGIRFKLKMKICIITLFFFIFIKYISGNPQLFKTTGLCKIKSNNVSIEVPSVIKAENDDNKIILTVCENELQQRINNCSTACVFNKNQKKLHKSADIVSLNIEEYDEVDKISPIVLKVMNKIKCNTNSNYDITIKMSVSATDIMLSNTDDCSLEITMPRIDYKYSCTERLSDGNLIDLRPLKSKKIKIDLNGKSYKISLCGKNSDCGQNIAGCVEYNNTKDILGTVETQLIRYDTDTNSVKVTASFRELSIRRKMEIQLKCNWSVPFAGNSFYKVPLVQGKNYKFQVDSSFGCVKIPPKCKIEDKSNGFVYYLDKLYTEMGYTVPISQNKYILLNICGPLKTNTRSKNNQCRSMHSQVCLIDNGNHVNLGSLSLPMRVVDGKFVRAVITDGSRCLNSSYTTTIDIKCSFKEKGPILQSRENCSTNIVWETPHACPRMEITGNKCTIPTPLGAYYLGSLYSEQDKVNVLSSGKMLKYNLCGNLHSSCNKFLNASACIYNGKEELIVGWSNANAEYSNGNLNLKYIGDRCTSINKKASLTFTFYCTFLSQNVIFKEVEKDCTFAVTIFDRSACLNKEIKDCKIRTENKFYDLSPLARYDKNYVVTDTNSANVKFYINVCAPLISAPDLLCPVNSMICRRENAEPHINQRFISVADGNVPSIENNSVVIRSTMGYMCKPGYLYKSLIKFECSRNEDLRLSKSEDCYYEFLWKTKHACSKLCSIGVNGFNLALMKPFKIEINQMTTEIDVCKDDCTVCFKETCLKKKISKGIFKLNETLILFVQLPDKKTNICDGEGTFNAIYIKLECDKDNSNAIRQIGEIKDCLLMLSIQTSAVCYDMAQYIADTPLLNISSKLSFVKEEESPVPPISKSQNETNSLNFCKNVKDMKLDLFNNSVIKSDNVYQINLNRNFNNCTGLICKNGKNIIEENDSCFTKNDTEGIRTIKLNSIKACDNDHSYVEINIKCNKTAERLFITKESTCNVTFDYHTAIVCKISVNAESHMFSRVFTFAVASLMGVLGVTLMAYYAYKHNFASRSRHYQEVESESKVKFF